VNKFKRRITRIAVTALLPAALVVGLSAVPASAQLTAATPSVAAHAATGLHQGDRSYYGWQDTGYGFYTYDECYDHGSDYYSDYSYKCVYTYNSYGYYYWELWVYYS
jgi:hypothetical protein